MSLKQLGAIDIDGTTNTVSTWYDLYTVPSDEETFINTIIVNNRNTTDEASVRIRHKPNGVTADVEHLVVCDALLQTDNGQLVIQVGICMAAGDILQVYSDEEDVNFIAWGDERLVAWE